MIPDIRPETCAVACSGGRDSMALLHAVHRRFPEGGFWVFHVDHGLREQYERSLDRRVIQNFCAGKRIPFAHHIVSIHELTAKSTNVESAARNARYVSLADMASARGVSKILLAHHGGDVAETQLMRLFQGWSSGEDIPAERGSLHPGTGTQIGLSYLRPWKDVDPLEINRYQRQHGIAFHEDLSNKDLRFTRNKIRNDIVPLLRKHFPALNRSLALLRRKERRNKEALSFLIRDFRWTTDGKSVSCELERFDAMPEAARIEILRRMAAELATPATSQSRMPYRDAEALMESIRDSSRDDTNVFIAERNGIRLETQNKFLYLTPCIVGTGKKGYLIFLTEEGEYRISGVGTVSLRSKNADKVETDKTAQVLSVPFLPIVIRSEKDHEPLPPFVKSSGFKSLKSYLSANGVPSHAIAELPLVEIGGELAYALTARWTGVNLGFSAGGLYREDFPFELTIKEMEFLT